MAFMARTNKGEVASKAEFAFNYELDSDDDKEVLSSLSRSELEIGLYELIKRYQLLLSKHKILKKSFVASFENTTIDEQNIYDLNEKLFVLEKSNIAMKSKVFRLEEGIFSNTSVTDEVIRYDRVF